MTTGCLIADQIQAARRSAQDSEWLKVKFPVTCGASEGLNKAFEAMNAAESEKWIGVIIDLVSRPPGQEDTRKELDHLFGYEYAGLLNGQFFAWVNRAFCQIEICFELDSASPWRYTQLCSIRGSMHPFSRIFQELQKRSNFCRHESMSGPDYLPVTNFPFKKDAPGAA